MDMASCVYHHRCVRKKKHAESFLPFRQAYRDGTTHYVPGVYKGLNRLLLNEICPLP